MCDISKSMATTVVVGRKTLRQFFKALPKKQLKISKKLITFL